MVTSVKVPSNVTSITVSGTVHTPSAGRITPASDALSTVLNHWHSRPKLRRSLTNGDVVIVMPSIVTSITIGGTVYSPNGSGEITVPAAVATAFLEDIKYAP